MRRSAPAHFLRVAWRRLFPRPEDLGVSPDEPLRFVLQASGVVHVGAHAGQEAWIYSALRKPVIWFEANPDLMGRLQQTIAKYHHQKAVNAVLLDRDDEVVDFLVTNYDGGSSSVLPLGGHKEMYPGIEVEQRQRLSSSTLKTQLHKLDPKQRFDALVLDVQGAEVLVLKGAGTTLAQFRWIFAECADFEIYEGGCTYQSLSQWLSEHGFKEMQRYPKDHKPGLGSTFDILFVRN
jgi:FkbM family methyltransferase